MSLTPEQESNMIADMGRKLLTEFEDNLVKKIGLVAFMGCDKARATTAFLGSAASSNMTALVIAQCVANKVDIFSLPEIERWNIIRFYMMEMEKFVRDEFKMLKNEDMSVAKFIERSNKA